jgi:hypothetical protein
VTAGVGATGLAKAKFDIIRAILEFVSATWAGNLVSFADILALLNQVVAAPLVIS